MNNWIFTSIGANENFLTSILPTAFCFLKCFLLSLSYRQSAVMTCSIRNETPRQSQVPHFRAWLLLSTDPVIALVGPAYIYCFRFVEYNVMRSSICATCLQECLKSGYRGCKHGLNNNTRLTQFCDPTTKKSVRWRHCQSDIGGPSELCLTISRNAFALGCIWLK